MIQVDETALICDFAETYHVHDWKRLPLQTAAAFAAGLRSDSRIMMRLNGQRATLTETLLAATVDNLRLLVWTKTKDAAHGRGQPPSIAAILTGGASDVMGFDSGEEFEKERAKMLKAMKGG